jgi:uncharacterized membrane protein (DUF2068 family)
MKPKHHNPGKALRLIAGFKLFKGTLLFLAGFGALALIHRDVGDLGENLVHFLHFDPDNHYIHSALLKLDMVTPRQLKLLSVGTFFYSALLLTEGIGLWLKKHWAEWLTVIASSLFIPVEVYEIFRHVTVSRCFILVVNVAIVSYLLRELKHNREEKLFERISHPPVSESATTD